MLFDKLTPCVHIRHDLRGGDFFRKLLIMQLHLFKSVQHILLSFICLGNCSTPIQSFFNNHHAIVSANVRKHGNSSVIRKKL